MTRLVKDGRVWIDRENRRVVVDGYVALRRGALEMFACPSGTKEHESIVGLLSKSQYVHAGLLAVGGKPGKPTRFDPYQPASGSTIKIHVLWKDAKEQKHIVRAQEWIQHSGTDQEMKYDWVFAGSGIYKDEVTGEETYLAEGGDLVCVANFPSATLDLAVRSDDTNAGLAFVAFTDRIPPEGTPVRLVFQVSDDPPARGSDKPDANKLPDVVKPLPTLEVPSNSKQLNSSEKTPANKEPSSQPLLELIQPPK
ncbi:MAG: YdjY domain-containing protein [Pirellulales bacterium]